MGFWHGMIKAGDLEMDATVNYSISSSAFVVKWDGSGISIKKWPADKKKEIDTSVGKIVIKNMQEDKEHRYFCEFSGIDTPTGPLAIEIGKTL